MGIPPRLFERTISLEEYLKHVQIPPVFVRYRGEGSRTLAIDERIKSKAIVVELIHRMQPTSRSSTSASINDEIEIYFNNKFERKCTQEELSDVFVALRQFSPDLFIDISSVGVRLMALIMFSLVEICDYQPEDSFKRVYCGYTESKDYKVNFIAGENNEGDHFRFYQSFDPLSPIPGYLSYDATKHGQRTWVVLLGFEGNRVHLIQNELDNIKEIKAYITMPTMKLGWINEVFFHNQHFLQGIDEKKPSIIYLPATSPFATYNGLIELRKQNEASLENRGIQVSPLGTKANALGALLFLLNDPYSALIYDNPNESTRVQEEASDMICVYEITEALRYDRNMEVG